MTHKNKILLITGIGDSFFSPSSFKKLDHGKDIIDKISLFLDQIKDKNIYTAYVNLLNYQDTNNEINTLTDKVPKTKQVTYSIFNYSIFDKWNNLTIIENNSEEVTYNGSMFNHLFPPHLYEVHICGVDLNGFYKDIIQELNSKNYKVVLYSDMIKRFKNTESNITAIKNKNFVYCSHRSVRL